MAKMSMQLNQSEAKTNSFSDAIDKAMNDKDTKELKKACVEFESYFLQLMLKEMRNTVTSKDGALPKGQEEQMFQEMLDEENSKNIASGRGIGLADMMFRQMTKNI